MFHLNLIEDDNIEIKIIEYIKKMNFNEDEIVEFDEFMKRIEIDIITYIEDMISSNIFGDIKSSLKKYQKSIGQNC